MECYKPDKEFTDRGLILHVAGYDDGNYRPPHMACPPQQCYPPLQKYYPPHQQRYPPPAYPPQGYPPAKYSSPFG